MRRLLFAALSIVLLILAATPAIGASDKNAVAFPMYATGNIGCNGAEDTSNKAGMAILRPVDGGINYHIVLTDVEPNWDYYVELQIQTSECLEVAHQITGFTSDRNGHLKLKGVFEMAPGTYMANIDVVSDPPDNVPPTPENREIGGFGYAQITVGD